MRPVRPLKVILYAALIGLLSASYVTPVQDIMAGRARISEHEADLGSLKEDNAARERLIEELNTPEGVERAARERYGMVKPGETVYIVEEE